MADTKRTTIMKALESLIDADGFFRTVERYHPAPHKASNLPAAFIYPVQEDVREGTDDKIKRQLRIIILVVVETNNNLAEAAEEAIGKIEAIVETAPGISGTVGQSRVSEIDMDMPEPGKPKAYGFITIECDYERARGEV